MYWIDEKTISIWERKLKEPTGREELAKLHKSFIISIRSSILKHDKTQLRTYAIYMEMFLGIGESWLQLSSIKWTLLYDKIKKINDWAKKRKSVDEVEEEKEEPIYESKFIIDAYTKYKEWKIDFYNYNLLLWHQ